MHDGIYRYMVYSNRVIEELVKVEYTSVCSITSILERDKKNFVKVEYTGIWYIRSG